MAEEGGWFFINGQHPELGSWHWFIYRDEGGIDGFYEVAFCPFCGQPLGDASP